MAKVNGTLYLVKSDGTTIGSTTNASLSLSIDLPETTTKGSAGWAEHLQGLRSWEGSFEGLYDETDTYGLTELYAEITNRTTFTILIESTTVGNIEFTGTASLSNIEATFEMEQPVGWSASFTGSGALTVAAST